MADKWSRAGVILGMLTEELPEIETSLLWCRSSDAMWFRMKHAKHRVELNHRILVYQIEEVPEDAMAGFNRAVVDDIKNAWSEFVDLTPAAQSPPR